MIDQPTENRKHSDMAIAYANQYHFIPVTDLGLQPKMEPCSPSLSSEVFRLEILPTPQYGGSRLQTAVLYLEGTAGSSYPDGPIHHADLPEPLPVAIVSILTTVCLQDIMGVAGLYDAVESAAAKLTEKELEQARKTIDRLTGRG